MDILKKAIDGVKRYRFALLVVLVGVVLMLLPTGHADEEEPAETKPADQATLTEELTAILGQIQGVGNVRVLLTEEAGAQTVYQIDENGDRIETVIITGSDRAQQGLISQVLPCRYRGAVIVCSGGDDPVVQLRVMEAVSKVTGLRSDQISVQKMK